MHACGHDGQTDMAIGAAKHLAEKPKIESEGLNRESLSNNLTTS